MNTKQQQLVLEYEIFTKELQNIGLNPTSKPEQKKQAFLGMAMASIIGFFQHTDEVLDKEAQQILNNSPMGSIYLSVDDGKIMFNRDVLLEEIVSR